MTLLAHLSVLSQDLLGGSTIHIVPFRDNSSNSLTDISVGLSRTTAILRLLTTPPDVAREIEYLTPLGLTTTLRNIRVMIFVYEEFATTNTDTAENIQNQRKELNVIDWTCETKVPKMTRALMICMSATAASFSIVEDTHTRVKETSDARLRTVICSRIGNFDNRAPLDFFRAENTELNPNNRFNFRTRSY